MKQSRNKEKTPFRVTIASYRTAGAAERAQEALREAGIEASLHEGSRKTASAGAASFQLQVAEKDRTAALEIVAGLTRPLR